MPVSLRPPCREIVDGAASIPLPSEVVRGVPYARHMPASVAAASRHQSFTRTATREDYDDEPSTVSQAMANYTAGSPFVADGDVMQQLDAEAAERDITVGADSLDGSVGAERAHGKMTAKQHAENMSQYAHAIRAELRTAERERAKMMEAAEMIEQTKYWVDLEAEIRDRVADIEVRVAATIHRYY